jgi:hypothetical protein
MIEFLRNNLIPIMVVLSVAIFAYRFYKLMRREKQEAEARKASAEKVAETEYEDAVEATDEEETTQNCEENTDSTDDPE